MAEKNNAVCSICDKEYYVCMSCADSMKLHPWKAFTDTQECYKVFQVVRGFSTGMYTKEEAKERLHNIDLSNLENYREHIKKIVKDILKEDKIVVETAKKFENIVIEDIATVEVEEIKTVEDVVVPIVSRRRNFKVNNEIEKVE